MIKLKDIYGKWDGDDCKELAEMAKAHRTNIMPACKRCGANITQDKLSGVWVCDECNEHYGDDKDDDKDREETI